MDDETKVVSLYDLILTQAICMGEEKSIRKDKLIANISVHH